jgi:hypothetical protein
MSIKLSQLPVNSAPTITDQLVGVPNPAGTDYRANLVDIMALMYKDFLGNFIVPGSGMWTPDSPGSTLAGSMTAIIAYINGLRVAHVAVNAHAFTASKDTYVDMDSTGTISYNEVANGAGSPALAANSVRIAMVATGGSSIASQASIYQSGNDSLGNLIYNVAPQVGKTPIMMLRQGSSATNWSAGGTQNYDPRGSQVMQQFGTFTWSVNTYETITFPRPFVNTPHMQATIISANGFNGTVHLVNTGNISFDAIFLDTTWTGRAGETFCWTATGI